MAVAHTTSMMGGLSPARLRAALLLLFTALAVPSAVLVWHTQRQLRWEAFHHFQERAESLAIAIDQRLQQRIAIEEARSPNEYNFLIPGGADAAYLQRSPLAGWPVSEDFPGLLGWFQVNPQGQFSTPLQPDPNAAGVSDEERLARRTRTELLSRILSSNRLALRSDERSANELAREISRKARRERDARQAELESSPYSSADEPARVAAAPAPRRSDSTAPVATAPPAERERLAEGSIDSLVEEESREFDSPDDFKDADTAEIAAGAQKKIAAGQVAFDELRQNTPQSNKLGRVEDLQLRKKFSSRDEKRESAAALEQKTDRQSRKESYAVLTPPPKRPAPSPPAAQGTSSPPADELVAAAPAATDPAQLSAAPRVQIFESEVDPFELAQLDSGHFVLYRSVRRDGGRFVQGAILDQADFLNAGLASAFTESELTRMSDLLIAWRGTLLRQIAGSATSASRAAELTGELLHQSRLSAPLDDFQLIFTINDLPPVAAGRIVIWTAALLFMILTAGFLALYGLGLRQLRLAAQQRDFVSAVSHELKTPLTSIRMYGEMLREGWVTEEKRPEYYSFIHDEAERLSRLISNVLQLARMERDELELDLREQSLAELFDLLHSRLDSSIARAGFSISYTCEDSLRELRVRIDADAIIQVMINLVDNALKFSAQAVDKRLEISAVKQAGHDIVIRVRDFGPGIAPDQLRKIFQLFYRPGSELSRETVGTGIGLALVRQLAQAMDGDVDAVNCEPGAEFRVRLPLV